METDLHNILTLASNFRKSPAEVEAHRKVHLEDKKIKEETRQEFNKLCDQFDDIISKGSDDIGKNTTGRDGHQHRGLTTNCI